MSGTKYNNINIDNTHKTNGMNTHNEEETVIIGVYNDVAEASAAKNKLENEGIATFMVDENVIGLNPLGGIELKILSRDEEKARKILQN